MGYLSQKKSENRINLILRLVLLGVSVLFVCSFLDEGSGVFHHFNALRFHYYMVIWGVFLYCLSKRFWFYTSYSAFLLILCFMSLEYSSRLLFNDNNWRGEEVKVVYADLVKDSNYKSTLNKGNKHGADLVAIHGSADTMVSKLNISREGVVKLSPDYGSYFVVAEVGDKNVVFISVDFSYMKEEESEQVFENLAELIKMQKYPVIVFGNFGLVAWNRVFSSFLSSTNLEVKNRIILSNGRFLINPFNVPTINVLGYKNMGLKDIEFLSKGKNFRHPILFTMSI